VQIARTFTNAACGWNLTDQNVGDIMERNALFSRCISLREGFNPDKHANLPDRAFDEPIRNKYGQTWVWTREEWEEAKKRYYLERLKLNERGQPRKEDLQRLGLDFVLPVLEPVGAIG
jgi:aldehyde:ferredoxin oxidoreductase